MKSSARFYPAMTAAAEGAEVTLTSLFTRDKMTAAEHEVNDALKEGVTILDEVMPVEVVLGDDGRFADEVLARRFDESLATFVDFSRRLNA